MSASHTVNLLCFVFFLSSSSFSSSSLLLLHPRPSTTQDNGHCRRIVTVKDNGAASFMTDSLQPWIYEFYDPWIATPGSVGFMSHSRDRGPLWVMPWVWICVSMHKFEDLCIDMKFLVGFMLLRSCATFIMYLWILWRINCWTGVV